MQTQPMMRGVLLSLIAGLILTGCGTAPNATPASTSSSEIQANGLFKSAEEKAIIKGLKSIRGIKRVSTITVTPKGASMFEYQAVVKAEDPGSMFWPQYVDQPWQGTLDTKAQTMTAQYLEPVPGGMSGPGPVRVIKL